MHPDQFDRLRPLAAAGFGLIDEGYKGGSGVITPQYAITIVGKNENDKYEIEIFSTPDNIGIPINEFSRKAVNDKKGFQKDENGHLVFKPQTLLNWKRRMGRDKNAPNIAILEKKLNGGSKKRKVSRRKKTRRS
jgi:hypothetical protein